MPTHDHAAHKKGNRYSSTAQALDHRGGVSRLHLIFAKVYDEKGNEEASAAFGRFATRQPAENPQARATHGFARHPKP